jgi:teichuronic acid biosynthesis glycosyltransferase TuaG
MMNRLVSIVMPAFNCRDYFAESVKSVLAQTYQDWELIIVDDCSTDGTVDIAKQYASQDARIRLFSMPQNSGPAVVRNKAIEESQGQYIAFLDSDDLWLPGKLEIQIRMMQEQKSLFCFSSYTPFRAGGLPMPIVRAPETVGYKRMLRGSVIGCLTVIYDASIIGKRYFSEGRDEIAGTVYSKMVKKLGHEDYMLWLNILKDCDAGLYPGRSVLGINESLAFYRLRDNSFSASKRKVALYQWIIYRRSEKIGLAKSIFYFVSYMIRGILKHKKISPDGKGAAA